MPAKKTARTSEMDRFVDYSTVYYNTEEATIKAFPPQNMQPQGNAVRAAKTITSRKGKFGKKTMSKGGVKNIKKAQQGK